MAKTLLNSSTHLTTLITLYTCPSDKYAKITVLYAGGSDNLYPETPHYSQRGAYLSINDTGILNGQFPFSGFVNSSTSTLYSDGLKDGTTVIPPNGILKFCSKYDGKFAKCSILVEEIDKTVIEA